jgi:hypothetical protein
VLRFFGESGIHFPLRFATGGCPDVAKIIYRYQDIFHGKYEALEEIILSDAKDYHLIYPVCSLWGSCKLSCWETLSIKMFGFVYWKESYDPCV